MTRYFVDEQGNYLGGFDGAEPPEGAIEVPEAPIHGLDKWANGAWVRYVAPPKPGLAEQIIGNPAELAKLKAALEI